MVVQRYALCTKDLQVAQTHCQPFACLQIMADALTMWEELGKIEGTKVYSFRLKHPVLDSQLRAVSCLGVCSLLAHLLVADSTEHNSHKKLPIIQ